MKPIKIYVDDTNADSLQQLKQHETALEETKNALLIEQLRLKKILQNLQLTQTVNKEVCQTGTQFNSNESYKENGATQTSLNPQAMSLEKDIAQVSSDQEQICPMCGLFFSKSVEFKMFHEHVLTHFTSESVSSFELVP
ncbi:uncharacterized protein LOC122848495 [Aphidius gifuensis]|uniref:uncharacterized protein LOC122848495 n=1 Tax=Aphidius gifuensis TaxID=684658 RepID=UPI001CDD3E77|nr:uncharacterized protein LOC122848495 [Aphidius gifuensis]